MSQTKPFFILPDVWQPTPFTTIRKGGGGKTKPAYGDRAEHAETLLGEYTSAIKGWDGKIIRLDISSNQVEDFPIDSLGDKRKGIRVLNVETADKTETTLTVTVYIPDNAQPVLQKKIEGFRDKITKKGAPRNEQLIGRVSNISPAAPRWYWRAAAVPFPDQTPMHTEVWLHREGNAENDLVFEALCKSAEIPYSRIPLIFPEALVYSVYANGSALELIAEKMATLNEFRPESEIAQDLESFKSFEQYQLIEDVLKRCDSINLNDPTVTVMDSGVSVRHPLIRLVLKEDMLLGRNGKIHDDGGHGTGVAGIASYGNLDVMLQNDTPILPFPIESYRLLDDEVDDSFTSATYALEAVQLIETKQPTGNRLLFSTITMDRKTTLPKESPSAWSSLYDSLACHCENDQQTGNSRLIILSAGNQQSKHPYDMEDPIFSVQEPNQAWNVVSVGAYTEKPTHSITDPIWRGYAPVAPLGGISPFSTNSRTWSRRAPIKPEIVCEGGNLMQKGDDVAAPVGTGILTLAKITYSGCDYFCDMHGTSPASALAAHIAACIMRQYPKLRAETVRALLIHSANWTPIMLNMATDNETGKPDYSKLLRTCGYGVPCLDTALHCLQSSATEIIEGTFQPFHRVNGTVKTRDMKYIKLPWPKRFLLNHDKQITLRVTLSYFPEPNPSMQEVKFNKYSYPAYRLKFDIKRKTETTKQHQARINKQVRDGIDDYEQTSPPDKGWFLNQKDIFCGSIHSNIWKGNASDLAEFDCIAIYPENGWWKTRPGLKRYDNVAHFSLVVSLYAEDETVDLYSEVKAEVESTIAFQVPVEAST